MRRSSTGEHEQEQEQEQEQEREAEEGEGGGLTADVKQHGLAISLTANNSNRRRSYCWSKTRLKEAGRQYEDQEPRIEKCLTVTVDA